MGRLGRVGQTLLGIFLFVTRSANKRNIEGLARRWVSKTDAKITRIIHKEANRIPSFVASHAVAIVARVIHQIGTNVTVALNPFNEATCA
jgi:hypothetical protein